MRARNANVVCRTAVNVSMESVLVIELVLVGSGAIVDA